MNVEDMAKLARSWFESSSRDDGSVFWARKDGAPEWLADMCYEAHGALMPDDWRYSFIVDALDIISEGDEDAEPEADIYTHDLLAWLSSNLTRVAYCEEAREEYVGPDATMLDIITCGQVVERREVLDLVREWLANNCDDVGGES